MRNKFVPALLAAILVSAPLASMARTSGYFSDAVVKSVNPSALTVTMDDGNTYALNYAAQANELKPGQHIAFNWIDVNGGSRLTSFQPS